MTIQKNLYICIIIGGTISCTPNTQDIEAQLHAAYYEKLCIIKNVDIKGHFQKIMECHYKIMQLEAHGKDKAAVNIQKADTCTTVKCQIMRLCNHISFNTQALIKLLDKENLTKLQGLNDKIHRLKVQLKTNNIDQKTFDMHPNMLFL